MREMSAKNTEARINMNLKGKYENKPLIMFDNLYNENIGGVEMKLISGVGIAIAFLLIYLWVNRPSMKDIYLTDEERKKILENFRKIECM